MVHDGFVYGLAQIVGSSSGAVSGLLQVRFLSPPAEPGVRFSLHRALHEIMSLLGYRFDSGQGDGILLPRYG
jgi:hypothetical protein